VRDTATNVTVRQSALVEPSSAASRFDSAEALRSSSDPLARRLSKAVDAGMPSEPQRADIQRIRRARQDMLADETRIEVLNFGAGSRDSERRPTPEESSAGYVTRTTIADVCRRAASKPRKGLTLYALVREFGPSLGLELGTCVGISTAYIATAMRHNGHGRLATLEGAPTLAEIARHTLDALALPNVDIVVGRFVDTLPAVLAAGTFDFAFIDGHHDEQATIDYHAQLLPYLSRAAVLVFDDIAWSDGMARAWDVVADHPSTVISVDLETFGVCVTRGRSGAV
jgi:predicted O-methyltransferase YrrM